MRKTAAIVVAVVVAATFIPWLRHQPFFSVLVAITAIVLAALIVLSAVRSLTKWSKKERDQEGAERHGRSSPRLRNVSLGAALILALILTVPHFIATNSGAYKLAVATANQAPQFTEALGAPIREAWFSEGRTEFGDSAKAELTIPVTGSKQRGDLQVIAVKEGGEWRLKELMLVLARSGERIDLLASPR